LLDGAIPSPTLRKLEIAANEAFDTYREMYYEGGVSSVYAFDIDDKFAVVVLIKKGKFLCIYSKP
jgi:capping protein beta